MFKDAFKNDASVKTVHFIIGDKFIAKCKLWDKIPNL